MSSAICFNLDQSKILSSVNGLNNVENSVKHHTINQPVTQLLVCYSRPETEDKDQTLNHKTSSFMKIFLTFFPREKKC